MRAGFFISAIGHAGAVMMTMLTVWQAAPVEIPESGLIVPVEVVDVSAETNVRALAPPQEEEEAAAVEEAAPEEPRPEAEAAPDQRQRQRPNDELDLAALERSLMVDKQREPRPERVRGEASERTQRGAGRGDAETARIEDIIRAIVQSQMRRCWREPVDLPNAERLIVTIEFSLDRDGFVRGEPRVLSPTSYGFDPAMRTAVDAAMRAVRVCEPYPFTNDPRVSDHYDLWRDQRYTFRPGQ